VEIQTKKTVPITASVEEIVTEKLQYSLEILELPEGLVMTMQRTVEMSYSAEIHKYNEIR